MAELNTYRIILPNGIEIELEALYYKPSGGGFTFHKVDTRYDGGFAHIPTGSAIIKL